MLCGRCSLIDPLAGKAAFGATLPLAAVAVKDRNPTISADQPPAGTLRALRQRQSLLAA
jgi:hypothetical protein